MADSKIEAILRKMIRKQAALAEENQLLRERVEEWFRAAAEQPKSIVEEVDAIPGRRIFYNLSARESFTAANAGLRGPVCRFLVSQDGFFVGTHYPLVTWKPNLPTTATNFGRWSPVGSWPLPTQQFALDTIDISYEVVDSGSQRNFNNEAAGPVLSRPDNLVPLPVPTLFAPATVIQFWPTFESIFFDAEAEVPTTSGQIVVTFPGYRAVNM